MRICLGFRAASVTRRVIPGHNETPARRRVSVVRHRRDPNVKDEWLP